MCEEPLRLLHNLAASKDTWGHYTICPAQAHGHLEGCSYVTMTAHITMHVLVTVLCKSVNMRGQGNM